MPDDNSQTQVVPDTTVSTPETVAPTTVPTAQFSSQPIPDATPKLVPANPGSWSDYKDSVDFDTLSSEDKNEALNKWAAAQSTYAKASGQYTPDFVQKFNNFVGSERKDLGPSWMQRAESTAGNFFKEAGSAILGGAGAGLRDLAESSALLGQKATNEISSLTGGSQDTSNPAPFLTSQALEAANIPSQISAKFNKQATSQIESVHNNLKTWLDNGNLDNTRLETAQDTLLNAVASRWGVSPDVLKQIPEYNLNSPQNKALLSDYDSTRDPAYLDRLFNVSTSDPRQAHIQQEINNLVGSSDNIGENVKHYTGSPQLAQLAQMTYRASTDPVMATLGAASLATGGAADAFLGGVGFNAALGAGSEYLTNPNSTLGSSLEAGLKGAAMVGAVHGLTLGAGLAVNRTADLISRKSVLEAQKASLSDPNSLTPASDQAMAKHLDNRIQEINDQLSQSENSLLSPTKEEPNVETPQTELPAVDGKTNTKSSVQNEPAHPEVEPKASEEALGEVGKTLAAEHGKGQIKQMTEEEEEDPLELAKHDAATGLFEIGFDHPGTEALSDRLEAAQTPEEVAQVKADIDKVKETLPQEPEPEPEKPIQPNAASGKEISFSELSPEYTDNLKIAEHDTSPEDLEKINNKQVEAEQQFNPEGFKDQLQNPDDADQIAAAARNKYRKQLLDNPNKEISPQTVLNSVKRDYFDKVGARADLQKQSLQTPLADESGALEDVIGQTPERTSTPEEQQAILQSALTKADLTPEERAALLSPDLKEHAKAEGISYKEVGRRVESGLTKMRNALQPELESGKITPEDAKEAFKTLLTKEANENPPISGSTTNKEAVREAVQPQPGIKQYGQESRTPEQIQEDSQKFQEKLKPFPQDVRGYLTSQRSSLYNLGLESSDQIHIINGGATDRPPVLGGGEIPQDNAMMVDFDHDGTPHLYINADLLSKDLSKLGVKTDGLIPEILFEEKTHIGTGRTVGDWGRENGYTNFYDALKDYAPKFLDGLSNLQVNGRDFLTDSGLTYTNGGFPLSDQATFWEASRQIIQSRADHNLTEQLVHPENSFIQKFVEGIKNLFKTLPKDDYVRYLVENTERLLGERPLDELPLSPVEESSGNRRDFDPNQESMVGAVPLPKPDPLEELTDKLNADHTLKTAQSLPLEDRLRHTDNTVAKMLGTAGDKAKAGLGMLQSLGHVMYKNLAELPKFTSWLDNIGNRQKELTLLKQRGEDYAKDLTAQYPDPNIRAAMRQYARVDGDTDALRIEIGQLKANGGKASPEYLKKEIQAREDALNLTDDQKKHAEFMGDYFDNKLQEGKKAGTLGNGVEDYFTRVLTKRPSDANKVAAQIQGEFQSGKLNRNSRFARQRVFNSELDLIRAGGEMEQDPAKIIPKYDFEFGKAMSSRTFVKNLFDMTEADGRPSAEVSGVGRGVADEGRDPATFVTYRKTANMQGYKILDHPALRGHAYVGEDSAGNPTIVEGPVYLHPDRYDAVKKYLDTQSPIRKNAIANFVLGAQSKMKQLSVAFPFMHYMQEAENALGHGVNPLAYKEVDFHDPNTQDAMQHGLALSDISGLHRFSEGLTQGHILDKIPVLNRLGKVSDFLFNKYIPYLKSETYANTLERLQKWHANELASGKISLDDLKYQAATVSNNSFGGLNYEMMGRSKTTQDLLSLLLFAPDFTEARGRTVAGAFNKYGGEQRRVLATLGLGQYLAARVVNQAVNGDPYWNKPFSYIVGGKEIQPRTIASDAVDLASSGLNAVFPNIGQPHGTAQFLENRLSPVAKTAEELRTGKDVLGRPASVTHALFDLATSVLPLGVLKNQLLEAIPKGTRPDSVSQTHTVDDLLSMFGIKSKDFDATSEMYERGRAYARSQGIADPQYPVSDYTDLRWALKDNNQGLIKEELNRLMQDRQYGDIRKAFQRQTQSPFTGQNSLEDKFYDSLGAHQKELYNQALKEKQTLYDRLEQYADDHDLDDDSGTEKKSGKAARQSLKEKLQDAETN